MRKNWTIIIPLFILISACQKELPHLSEYQKSKKQWELLKKERGNSYSYELSWSSWTGYSGVTKITVKNDTPVGRKYTERTPGDQEDPTPKEIVVYEENETNLNSHNKGEKARTIDEIYTTCYSEYLKVNKNENEISFNVDEIGAISSCGYVPKGCVDDCFRGVTLHNLTWTD